MSKEQTTLNSENSIATRRVAKILELNDEGLVEAEPLGQRSRNATAQNRSLATKASLGAQGRNRTTDISILRPYAEQQLCPTGETKTGPFAKRKTRSASQSQVAVLLLSIGSRPARRPNHPSDRLLTFAVDRVFLISRCTRRAHAAV
jgi:hypothetical protein